MKILFVVAEVAPYVKTGGLGEVMNALPKEIHRLGHEVAIFMPLHGKIDRQRYPLLPMGRKKTLRVGRTKIPHRFMASLLSQEVPVYFFDQPELFGSRDQVYGGEDRNYRFLVFNKAIFSLLETLDWKPDIIHCHDWPTGLIPNYFAGLSAKSSLKDIRTVFTIHNPAFTGTTRDWKDAPELKDILDTPIPASAAKLGYTNFLERGIRFADVVTTVSEPHAEELKTPLTDHGLGTLLKAKKKHFFGVRNGIDYNIFNPRIDSNLPVNYDEGMLHRKYDNKRALQHRLGLTIDEKLPILGMNTRITEQKGFKLIFEILPKILKLGVQFVVVGTGYESYVKTLNAYAKEYSSQVAYRPYSEELGSLVYAGADLFLMPSRYEPSGLGQMVSLRYGTIPLVRRTGGLGSTIINYNSRANSGNGFVFNSYTGSELLTTIKRALRIFQNKKRWWELMHRAMNTSYTWELPAKRYVKIYQIARKF